MKKTMETLKKVNRMLASYAYAWYSYAWKLDKHMAEKSKGKIGKNVWQLLGRIDEYCMKRCKAAC